MRRRVDGNKNNNASRRAEESSLLLHADNIYGGQIKNGMATLRMEGKTYGALLTKRIKGEIKCSLKTKMDCHG